MAALATNKRQRQKQAQQARRAYLQAQQRRAQRRRKALASVALLLILGLVVASFVSTDRNEDEPDAAPQRPDCSPVAGKSTFAAPPPETIDKTKSYGATVETDVGTFTVSLDDEKAPKTVNNFVFLARNQFYDCVPFHRVIPGFVVQGGDGEKGTGTGGPG